MSLDRLLRAAQELDPAQVELLCEMADAFGWSVQSWTNPASDLVSDGFGDSLLNRLRLHHATSDEKFNKTSFEYAFKSASKSAGRKASKTESHTYQGADMVVDGTRWSLKTEGSQKMSKSSITISKFSEARWIRDCITPSDFAREATARLMRHLSEYDRIATLRGAYVDNQKAVKYELVEIPHATLSAIGSLSSTDFSPRTKVGSSSATVRVSDGESFKLTLDGSVEKVTLRNIKIAHCTIHGVWTVPVLPAADQ